MGAESAVLDVRCSSPFVPSELFISMLVMWVRVGVVQGGEGRMVKVGVNSGMFEDLSTCHHSLAPEMFILLGHEYLGIGRRLEGQGRG